MRLGARIALAVVALAASPSCKKSVPAAPRVFDARMDDHRFLVADHFLASIEMQISGEPLAQLLGKNLAGYNRFSRFPDLYTDDSGVTGVDPVSYSMAVESYEYSKQPMNNTSFESGAGLSLAYGPILNPQKLGGDDAFALLRDRLQHLAQQAGAAGPAGSNWVIAPAPTANPLNVYGWPGYWPVFAEFRSFDPDIAPTGGATRGCSVVGGYAASTMGLQTVGDYECGYNSLNLPLRETQVEKILEPAALGFALWKQALWVINYWQSLHDAAGNRVTDVADAELPNVGQPGSGIFLGDVALEGWQGLTMLDEMDNKAALMLTRLLTSDGTTLGGFASTKAALAYDYTSPLRWWPAAIAVTESGGAAPPAGSSWKQFPQPTAFAVTDGRSRLRGLAALAAGWAELFALTDARNAEVGGGAGPRATFDGDPFPADNGLPDGEESPHDRALANLKVALVDLDRLHFDAAHGVLVDDATADARGTTVTTVDAAYTIVALRTAYRALSSSLTLYSNDTPDTQGGPTALDGAPFAGAPAPVGERILQLIRAEADFLAGKLVGDLGGVANGWDLATDRADPSPTRVESEAAAVRGLLDAWLATSDVRYRAAAAIVFADFDRRFWMRDVRAMRTTANVDAEAVWTPLAFGTVQGALRQYWKLVGRRPGNGGSGDEILARIGRLNKLVANGWDDANGDGLVQYPDECTGAGLQMAERLLTGELSHFLDEGDRDHDCVPEIAAAKLPAALAAKIVLHRRE
ncbi:MAG: hypothetical protein JWN44_6448 [Myxococcales bacterium]|nr:hypothetical protein [Myxococcales bacterium]